MVGSLSNIYLDRVVATWLARHGTRAVGLGEHAQSVILHLPMCQARHAIARACALAARRARVTWSVVYAAGDVATVGYTTDKY